MTIQQPDIKMTETDLSRIEKLLAAMPKTSSVRLALETELGPADVVASNEISDDVVTMNSTMRFVINATGADFTLPLVYPKDMLDNGETISILHQPVALCWGLE